MSPLLRIGWLPLVSKHRIAGHHRKVRQLREAVDQALRDPIAEIFRFWVVAVYVRESKTAIESMRPRVEP